VVPFTTLQSPDDSDIEINVYVWSDDMQVNTLNAGDMPTQREILSESGEITDVTCFELNESSADSSNIALDHFGERPLSYRALLKRYVTRTEASFAADATLRKTFTYTTSIVPLIVPTFGTNGNTYPTLLNYLRYAYVGLRGSLRYRIMGHGQTGEELLKTCKISMEPPGVTDSGSSSISAGSADAILSGTITLTPHSNPGLECEIPYYSSNLFSWSFNRSPTADSVVGDMEPGWSRLFTTSIAATGATDTFQLALEVATGEDFSLLRFQGSPYYTIP
jgi:hypothetical protein